MPIPRHLVIALLLCALGVLPARAADPVRGQDLFLQHCMSCHAPGRPMPGAPDFTQGQKLFQPDGVLLEKIRDGVDAMPGYRGILDNTMILDVIAYMRTLQ